MQQEIIHAEQQIWQDHVIHPLLLCGFTVSFNLFAEIRGPKPVGPEILDGILIALFDLKPLPEGLKL